MILDNRPKTQGIRARLDGFGLDACPFGEDRPQERDAWLRGWAHADRLIRQGHCDE